MFDFFDPNSWQESLHEFRIYGDDRCSTWAIVDAVDYRWAIQWKWHINKPHPTRNGKKEYFRRSQSNGKRYLPPLYLHVEIMKRNDTAPPNKTYFLVDHLDGNEWNCRRNNLRWATTQQNNQNRFGAAVRQGLL